MTVAADVYVSLEMCHLFNYQHSHTHTHSVHSLDHISTAATEADISRQPACTRALASITLYAHRTIYTVSICRHYSTVPHQTIYQLLPLSADCNFTTKLHNAIDSTVLYCTVLCVCHQCYTVHRQTAVSPVHSTVQYSTVQYSISHTVQPTVH